METKGVLVALLQEVISFLVEVSALHGLPNHLAETAKGLAYRIRTAVANVNGAEEDLGRGADPSPGSGVSAVWAPEGVVAQSSDHHHREVQECYFEDEVSLGPRTSTPFVPKVAAAPSITEEYHEPERTSPEGSCGRTAEEYIGCLEAEEVPEDYESVELPRYDYGQGQGDVPGVHEGRCHEQVSGPAGEEHPDGQQAAANTQAEIRDQSSDYFKLIAKAERFGILSLRRPFRNKRLKAVLVEGSLYLYKDKLGSSFHQINLLGSSDSSGSPAKKMLFGSSVEMNRLYEVLDLDKADFEVAPGSAKDASFSIKMSSGNRTTTQQFRAVDRGDRDRWVKALQKVKCRWRCSLSYEQEELEDGEDLLGDNYSGFLGPEEYDMAEEFHHLGSPSKLHGSSISISNNSSNSSFNGAADHSIEAADEGLDNGDDLDCFPPPPPTPVLLAVVAGDFTCPDLSMDLPDEYRQATGTSSGYQDEIVYDVPRAAKPVGVEAAKASKGALMRPGLQEVPAAAAATVAPCSSPVPGMAAPAPATPPPPQLPKKTRRPKSSTLERPMLKSNQKQLSIPAHPPPPPPQSPPLPPPPPPQHPAHHPNMSQVDKAGPKLPTREEEWIGKDPANKVATTTTTVKVGKDRKDEAPAAAAAAASAGGDETAMSSASKGWSQAKETVGQKQPPWIDVGELNRRIQLQSMRMAHKSFETSTVRGPQPTAAPEETELERAMRKIGGARTTDSSDHLETSAVLEAKTLLAQPMHPSQTPTVPRKPKLEAPVRKANSFQKPFAGGTPFLRPAAAGKGCSPLKQGLGQGTSRHQGAGAETASSSGKPAVPKKPSHVVCLPKTEDQKARPAPPPGFADTPNGHSTWKRNLGTVREGI